MQLSCFTIALIAAASLLVRQGRAQRAPVAPLAPIDAPAVVPIKVTGLGVLIEPRRTAATQAANFSAAAQSQPRIPWPLFLINSKIVINGALLNIYPRDIANIIVYKDDKMPANWRTTPNNGMIEIFLKKSMRVPSRSLASLKHQAHLHGPVRFAVDGQLLPDASLRVATSCIAKLEVRPAAHKGESAELNILLVEIPPTNYPPGTIMIRGTASR